MSERIEIPIKPSQSEADTAAGQQYNPILAEIRQFAIRIRSHIRREHKLGNFESTRASDPAMHPDSMIEDIRQTLTPIFDSFMERAIIWYKSEEAEKIKSELVYDYRETLQSDGSVKATGRPVYPSPKQRKAKSNPLDGLDKETLIKMIQAQMKGKQ